jgi:hypothetical protein
MGHSSFTTTRINFTCVCFRSNLMGLKATRDIRCGEELVQVYGGNLEDIGMVCSCLRSTEQLIIKCKQSVRAQFLCVLRTDSD